MWVSLKCPPLHLQGRGYPPLLGILGRGARRSCGGQVRGCLWTVVEVWGGGQCGKSGRRWEGMGLARAGGVSLGFPLPKSGLGGEKQLPPFSLSDLLRIGSSRLMGFLVP